MKVIGMCGPKRSGKDTLGAIIAEELEAPVVHLADPLYDFVGRTLGLTRAEMEAIKDDVPPLDCLSRVRDLLKPLGTEWGRRLIGEDVWIRMLDRENGHLPLVVVSDVRFPNEAEWARRNGVLVHVKRDGAAWSPHDHASEHGVKAEAEDIFVRNDGPPAEVVAGVLPAIRVALSS